MTEKAAAFKQSAASGDNKPVLYQACGPYGSLPYSVKKGVYANDLSINSVVNAADVHVDATAVAGYHA